MHRLPVTAARSLAAVALALVAASCSDDPEPTESGAPAAVVGDAATTTAPASDTTGATVPAPDGLPDFYATPDPVPDLEPGTLLAAEPIELDGLGGRAYRIMYVSESLAGDPIAVTGLAAVPEGDAPEGGFPVVAWAHGTTGIADVCAPSLEPEGALGIGNALLEAGYAIAATDYEGLGTPGRHPYIVGESEGRGVLDSVRAARQLDGAELSTRYLVWGHSQGGHAALYAQHLAASWAPELELVGTVAGAPPSQFELLNTALQASPFKHYLLMVAAGFNAAYGDEGAPLEEVLTPAGVEMVATVDEGCDAVAQAIQGVDTSTLIGADPASIPAWLEALHANDPGLFEEPSDAPLLVIHGGNDEQIPVIASSLMFDQLCAIGQDQTRWVYPGQSHSGVVATSLDDMLTWIENRFADGPSPDPYEPTGQADVQVQRCPEG
jgi:pimeloyl-ACP methyl ester carboxylesterase